MVPSATPRAASLPTADPDLAENSAAVDAIFEDFIGPRQPGAAVVVLRDGRVLYRQTYGLADLAKRTPITPDTLFHLGSVGKQMTALAVMQLAAAGQVDYDEPIGRYLPELARLGDKVTIRRLLQHTSGFPDYYSGKLLEQLYETSDMPTNADALALLADSGKLKRPPGAAYDYSNSGYDMLGSLIERVSGQDYAAFLREHVFQPAGMTDTFSLPDAARRAQAAVAHSYVRSGGQVERYDSDPLDNLFGSGSIYSSIEDMARYEAALADHRLLPAERYAEALKPARLTSGSRSNYGFGWNLGRHERQPYAYHDGSWLGFISYYTRFPDQGLAVIVLLNRDYDLPDEDLATRVADVFLGEG